MQTSDVIIIGAGMTGIAAGIAFQSLGEKPILLDKGKGFGGRMATRRIEASSFDHGAQYIQPSLRFLNWLQQNSSSNQLSTWNFASSKKIFIAPQGMSSLAKDLSKTLKVQLNSKVTTLKRHNEAWLVEDESGQSYSSKKVLLTAPLPQALALLEQNNIMIDDTELSSITYRPCLALMMNLSKIHNLPETGGMFIKNPILEWVCDNKKKGLTNELHSVTVHCTEAFSKDKYDLSDEKIYDLIYAEFQKYFPNELTSYEVKKWKYASPLAYYKSVYYRSQFPGLYLAGDAFGGNSLDGAFRSGSAAAYVMKDDILV